MFWPVQSIDPKAKVRQQGRFDRSTPLVKKGLMAEKVSKGDI
jgi:hypothetical protein